MVGNARLELTTPRSQSVCASQLRQFPIFYFKKYDLRITWSNPQFVFFTVFLMERVMRLELTTLCLEGRCSSQLSYTRIVLSKLLRYLIEMTVNVKIFLEFFRFYYVFHQIRYSKSSNSPWNWCNSSYFVL